MRRTYLHLLDEIHQLTLLPKTVLAAELTHLSVRGADFSMHAVNDHDQSSVVIHCELGALPTHRREEVLARLLDTNFHMISSGKSVTFCRNEQSGHLMLSMAQPLSSLSGQVAIDQMGALAEYALIWRQNYFLDEASAAQPASGKQAQQSVAAASWRAN